MKSDKMHSICGFRAPWREVLPGNRLMGMCCQMGWHFQQSCLNGVAHFPDFGSKETTRSRDLKLGRFAVKKLQLRYQKLRRWQGSIIHHRVENNQQEFREANGTYPAKSQVLPPSPSQRGFCKKLAPNSEGITILQFTACYRNRGLALSPSQGHQAL